MAYANSSKWVEKLEQEGELLRVREPACVELEIAAAADQESKSGHGGKALLFESPVRRGWIGLWVSCFDQWIRIGQEDRDGFRSRKGGGDWG